MTGAEGGMRQAVRIGGRHISYLEAGVPDGRVLVLLHAFPLSADMYRAQLESVPSGWRLIAPDLPGLGLSEDGDETPTLDDYAKAMLQLTDRLALSSAAIGGWLQLDWLLHRRSCWRLVGAQEMDRSRSL